VFSRGTHCLDFVSFASSIEFIIIALGAVSLNYIYAPNCK
jgi:hypothetical protein